MSDEDGVARQQLLYLALHVLNASMNMLQQLTCDATVPGNSKPHFFTASVITIKTHLQYHIAMSFYETRFLCHSGPHTNDI